MSKKIWIAGALALALVAAVVGVAAAAPSAAPGNPPGPRGGPGAAPNGRRTWLVRSPTWATTSSPWKAPMVAASA